MYYVIVGDSFYTSDDGVTLKSLYPDNIVGVLPSDFKTGKYIVQYGELVLNPEYENIEFARTKANKYEENDKKATETRYSQEFTLTIQEQECLFDTTEQTQRDLLTAFAVCSSGGTYDGWVTNNGVELDLTLEDVSLISATFKEKSDVYGKWNEYKTAIDKAETLEELEEIEIDYDKMDNE